MKTKQEEHNETGVCNETGVYNETGGTQWINRQ